MQFITQPNNWTCAAACVCMITNTELEDFYRFCGHDGSDNVAVTPERWMGKRCFDMKEIIRFLLEYDLFLGFGASGIPADFDPIKNVLQIECDWEKQDVLIGVASGPDGKGLHQVFWSRELKRVVDPYMPETERQLSDYHIVDCWPVVRIREAMS